MTLLIAGYQYERKMTYAAAWLDAGADDPRAGWDPEPSGVFMVADSAITSGSTTLLNGFRKIYPVGVNLWKPYFLDGYFHSYNNVHQELDVMVGFAGNTLTAQHCLNGLTEHLANLRIAFKHPRSGPLKMAVLMDCQDNPFDLFPHARMEDDFDRNGYSKLLTADKLAHVVLHSLSVSMKSARQYKMTQEAFDTLNTPFVVGIQCPQTRAYAIYVYRMVHELVDGMNQVRVDMAKLAHGDVAVLGMEREFAVPAQQAYTAAIAGMASPHQAMFDFLCASIRTVVARGDKAIAFPALGKTLERFRVETKLRQV